MSTPTLNRGYILNVLIGLDVFINALLGGRAYETISARIGRSILNHGWGARVPWPDFLYQHFLANAE